MSLTASDEVFRKTNHDELELLEANYYKLPFCDEDMKQFEAMDSATDDWVNSMLEERFMNNTDQLLAPSSPSLSSASLSPSSNSSTSSASNTNEHTYSLINDRPDTPLTAVKFEDFSNDYQLGSDPDFSVYFVKDGEHSPLNDLENAESHLSPTPDGNNFTFESTPDYIFDDFNVPASKPDSIHHTMDRTLASTMEVTGNNVITISKMGNTVHVRKEFESPDEPMDYSMAKRTRPNNLSTSSSYSSHCSDNSLGSISSSSHILALAAEAGQLTSCSGTNQQHVLNRSDKATVLASNDGHTAKVTTNSVTHRTQIQIPTSTLQTILKSGRLITKLQQEGQFLPRIKIKTEPYDGEQQYVRICQPQVDVHLPPTPPSSNTSDNEGSSSPRGGSATTEKNSQISTSLNVGTSASQLTSQMLTSPQRLTQSHGPLYLTEEEKRTLMSEGYQIPVKLPLTKGEEKALKKIRRKIKNKISAQESRRKKKEYVEALERKMESYNQENGDLRRKLDSLENSNQSLLGQLRSLQMLVAEKMTKPSRTVTTQTSSCLMVLVLCFAVFLGGLFPILTPSLSDNLMTGAGGKFSSSMEITGNWRSRVLLSFQDDSIDKIGFCTDNDCYGPAARQAWTVDKHNPDPDLAAQDTNEAATAGSDTYDEPASGRIVMNDTGDQIGQIIANTMEPRDVAAVLASRKMNVNGKKSDMAAVEIIAHDTKKLVSVSSHVSE